MLKLHRLTSYLQRAVESDTFNELISAQPTDFS